MYHSVSDDVDADATPYFRTVTSPKAFERQMRFLSESGYRAVTLTEACRAIRDWGPGGANRADADRPVAITFDDGFHDIRTTAFPIMQRLGMNGTVFLSTAYIGRDFITGRRCLGEADVRELAKDGVEFGSHTATHPQLKTLAREGIRAELSDSKRQIEEIIGSEVNAFSYPYRFPEEDELFVQELGDLLAEAGYKAGVTTSIGRSGPDDAPLFMKRLPINDCDDLGLFKAKLDGAYDWVHTGQIAYKKLRAAGRRNGVLPAG